MLSWHEYDAHRPADLQAFSGADYILHRLEQQASPPQGWNPRDALLTVLPVLPPGLRPLSVERGKEWKFDLNLLYRRVLVANGQLASILENPAAEAKEVNRLKRRLYWAVHELFLGGYKDRRGHRYRSIGELLKGKEGILRQHLLGKRANYSGRSVIVPGPELKMDECGLPETLIVGMFKDPLVDALARERGVQKHAASASLELRQPGELEDLLTDTLVLLNRAPTLHRYNILAFRPRLRRDHAIALHPLVCGGFNADFDGDTMAVHIPLLRGSLQDSRRCLPSRHLLSIANGRLSLHFTQDLVAGIYWKTLTTEGRQALNQIFGDPEILALDPTDLCNPVDKKAILGYLTRYLEKYDEEQTGRKADELMRWGFAAATRAGLTLSLWDVPWIASRERKALLETLMQEGSDSGATFEQMKRQGGLAYEALMDRWKERVKEALGKQLEGGLHLGESSPDRNPLAVIINSGARGSLDDACQLGGLRGLMDRLDGRCFEEPVDANFLEGLSPLEYFISAFGGRKTMVDKKLKTANAGDLTRRLVEGAYALTIVQEGACESDAGIALKEIEPFEGRDKGAALENRLLGRLLAADVPANNSDIIAYRKGTIIASRRMAADIAALVGPTRGVKVRSPLTCRASGGICQHCYGWDLSRLHLRSEAHRFPEPCLPVGIVAGQSIGERGTQLTMRTFHSGGVRGEDITQGLPRVKRLVEGRLDLRLFRITRPGDARVQADQVVDEWALYQHIQSVTAAGGRRPAFGPVTQDPKTPTVRLTDMLKGKQEEGLAELSQLFLWAMHRIYGDDVDSRHFEVVLRAMLKQQQETLTIRGVSQAALDRQGFLAAASFQRALQVLAQAAVEGREDWVEGYKERIMLGAAIHSGRDNGAEA